MRYANEARLAATTTASDRQLEDYRKELTGFCYRMVGSAHDADDAVQETMIRAWRGIGNFEGRSSLRSWLYRIATNVCFDQLDGRRRRALPMDLGGPTPLANASIGAAHDESTWIQPIADSHVLADTLDPADRTVARESVRLAFVGALQHLPPRQRAVLILRDVLRWKASEVAHLLGTTVVSVNSALQRARVTLAASNIASSHDATVSADEKALLDRYVDAFERYDIDELVSLLHEDATLSMPPFALWLRGKGDLDGWFRGHGAGCNGSRLVPVKASGAPAFGQYRPAGAGIHEPFALQVLEVSAGRITGIHAFLDTGDLFPRFRLPARLTSSDVVTEQHVVEADPVEQVS